MLMGGSIFSFLGQVGEAELLTANRFEWPVHTDVLIH